MARPPAVEHRAAGRATLLLLAGGQSRRMGREKALLPFGGEPLIRRIARRLEPVTAELLVVTSRPEPYRQMGYRVVADPPGWEGQGPLAALRAGLAAARQEAALLVACDMPFASPCLARLLLAEVDRGWPAALPVAGGRAHPLFAAYRRDLATKVEEALRAGVRSLAGFLAALPARRLAEEEISPCGPPERLLINVNRPEEYRQALRTLALDPDPEEAPPAPPRGRPL
ncbi:MAG: molybdenum cofactor guanylyltransferase [Bacillota bacterium]|nr:molybdenum cofactor guanylyltransferase [Bacillota bacterium]